MFGLSWGQILIIVLVGMFVLGPERIPVAVQWSINSLKKIRTMAQGAQDQLQKEIGPEMDELRRQIADLQSLKEVQELRNLRDLHPRKLIGKGLLGNEGGAPGIAGFLGFEPGLFDDPTKTKPDAGAQATEPAAVAGVPVAPVPVNGSSGASVNGASVNGASVNGSSVNASANGSSSTAVESNGAPVAASVSGDPVPARPSPRPLAVGERPPFDPDGT